MKIKVCQELVTLLRNSTQLDFSLTHKYYDKARIEGGSVQEIKLLLIFRNSEGASVHSAEYSGYIVADSEDIYIPILVDIDGWDDVTGTVQALCLSNEDSWEGGKVTLASHPDYALKYEEIVDLRGETKLTPATLIHEGRRLGWPILSKMCIFLEGERYELDSYNDVDELIIYYDANGDLHTMEYTGECALLDESIYFYPFILPRADFSYNILIIKTDSFLVEERSSADCIFLNSSTLDKVVQQVNAEEGL